MEWYEALLLGIIQGLTEFLPVSSSGHLEISSYLLNTDTSQNLFFNMMVHVATAFSILYVFREDIFKLIGEPYISSKSQKMKSKAGLGLGTFIGKTLLERKKANIEFLKSSNGGALVEISWNNKDFV